ncbi:hypothetical protein AB0G73_26865 [Streptomyces sp. NPDC020719]|uniref:hypothetical protein n=1 Tax=unclassified Streptomyces TaxID=2593676 RepID=UPI0033DFB621
MSVPVPQPVSPLPASARSAATRRRLGLAAGAALLTLASAACATLDRTAVGTFSYSTAAERIVKISSPPVKGCHQTAPAGATAVLNNTLADVRMYRTPDCSGDEMKYIPSRLADNIAPNTLPWRSYAFVH